MESKIQNYISNNRDRFLNELMELLKIPSVSADPAYKADVLKTADAVAQRLREAGVDNVEICPTAGYPIVYGDKIIDPTKSTVLVYGHYDVQPADPLDLWHSPPFEPVIKNDRIYARGSADDKGQMYMHVKAFEIMMKENILPCNVKFMIEGEEEVGSANLGTFTEANRAKLACDCVLISDTSLIANDIPSITVGLRGLAYIEVLVNGPNRDLHSGVYGGAVANPINALCEMISKLIDEKSRKITIPGFYDDVLDLSTEERTLLNQIPFSAEDYKSDLKIDATRGEEGYTIIEQTSTRPTLDVNGIKGGYLGEGAKTVLPSWASAKISMRLVPNQHPDKIQALFKSYFESLTPAGCKTEVSFHHGGEAVVVPIDTPEFKASSKAMEKTFGKAALPARGGGSIPIVALFEQVLGVKSVLMGFGLDSDDIHSPNENYGVWNYFKGIETIPYFFHYYTEMKQK